MMRWFCAAICLVVLATGAQAASIQARLIRASNEKAPADDQLKEIVPKLKPVFGYAHYKQIGFQTQSVKDKEMTTLDLGEGFVLNVTPKSVVKKVHTLDINCVSGKISVVQATIEVGEKKPVFIKGPEVGSTLLIIAVSVVE
jgi:hypothetical protein